MFIGDVGGVKDLYIIVIYYGWIIDKDGEL